LEIIKNNMQKIHNNLFQFEDLPLTQLSHTFAESYIWHAEGMDKQIATYDLVIRDMPQNRNYMVASGLEEVVYYLQKFSFTKQEVDFLVAGGLIPKKFAKYMLNLRFTGELRALPEGTIFFPGEPIFRVTAPIIEASLLEIFFFNVAVSNILFTTKASRLRSASRVLPVSSGLQRSQSFESGFKGLRALYICGVQEGGIFPAFIKKYNLKQPEYLLNGQHLFIKSFDNELMAFEKMVKYYGERASFMIDTYHFDTGLKNAMQVAKEMKKRGQTLRYVCIDGGDLNSLTRKARRILDKNNLHEVKILIAGNLDEYKIKKMVDAKLPADCYVSATEFSTVFDSPKLEAVYKIAELRDGTKIIPTAKLTPGKLSLPGRKQIFRKFEKGKMVGDIIGLENEKLGTPLLKTIMRNGKLVAKLPDLNGIKKYFDQQFKTIPEKLFALDKKVEYSVKISPKLQNLLEQVRKKHVS